jgi:hypothetical protein
MTELDHAPATAETADRPPAGEQRPGSADSQARYPSAVTAADTDPGYYDGDIQQALAADTTPTRQQAARDASGHDQAGADTANASDDAPAGGRDADIEAILHEDDNVPDSRTRQQAARDASADNQADSGTPAASHDAPAGGHDPDIEAILHEDDNLPDPRTRQQAGRDASGTSDQYEQSGPDPLAETVGKDHLATTGPAADDQAADRASPTPGTPELTGPDQPFSVVHIGPDERTVGDDTPAGIGLKPTGDQLLEMEGRDSRERRTDRLIGKLVEHGDDVRDSAGELGEAIEADSHPPGGPSGHPEAYTGHPAHENHQMPESHGTNDAVGAIVMATIVGVAGLRSLSRHLRKGA